MSINKFEDGSPQDPHNFRDGRNSTDARLEKVVAAEKVMRACSADDHDTRHPGYTGEHARPRASHVNERYFETCLNEQYFICHARQSSCHMLLEDPFDHSLARGTHDKRGTEHTTQSLELG
jgi:hypothetical protein